MILINIKGYIDPLVIREIIEYPSLIRTCNLLYATTNSIVYSNSHSLQYYDITNTLICIKQRHETMTVGDIKTYVTADVQRLITFLDKFGVGYVDKLRQFTSITPEKVTIGYDKHTQGIAKDITIQIQIGENTFGLIKVKIPYKIICSSI